MQAENRFLQQWNSYIRVAARRKSGLRTRKLTQAGLSVGDVGGRKVWCMPQ